MNFPYSIQDKKFNDLLYAYLLTWSNHDELRRCEYCILNYSEIARAIHSSYDTIHKDLLILKQWGLIDIAYNTHRQRVVLIYPQPKEIELTRTTLRTLYRTGVKGIVVGFCLLVEKCRDKGLPCLFYSTDLDFNKTKIIKTLQTLTELVQFAPRINYKGILVRSNKVIWISPNL